MKIRESYRKNWAPYIWAMPDIMAYQLISNSIFGVIYWLLRKAAMMLIKSTGHVAISSGDFAFLFKTWQGPLLLIIALTILFFHVATDINVQIAYAGRLLKGIQIKFIDLLRESFISIKNLFTPDGILIIIYIALIAPLCGLGLSISLTSSLYIPTFITSVIHANVYYNILYFLLLAIFFFVGIINIFTLHGIVIEKLPSNKADNQSRQLVRNNWKDYLKQNVSFILNIAVCNILLGIFTIFVPLIIAFFLKIDQSHHRMLFIFICCIVMFFIYGFNSYVESFYIIRLTQLFYRYKGDHEGFVYRRSTARVIVVMMFIILPIIISFGASFLADEYFDELFYQEVSAKVIAHRGGGVEEIENTIAGVEKAIELKADGSEIDVQRTADGHYIINHDGNFARLCSNKRKPEELTLEEIKNLKIKDPNHPDKYGEVATIEEMLETVKGRIKLFIELKGNSADRRMVDDLVAMIKERDMMSDCVLISLKYDLIDYCENNYPEIDTAYLAFVSFGDTSKLNCDYLGLEEEASSNQAINNVHDQNKQFLVWTPNSTDGQRHFLLSTVDYIITDNIKQAKDLVEELNNRSDYELIIDAIISLF